MQNKRRTIDIGEVVLWTNWIKCSSRTLSVPPPPMELLILFVVQSVRLAHSLRCFLDESLPQEVVDGHVRGYLLDRVWSYHLLTALVQRDVRASGWRVAEIDSKQLLRASRTMVARVMLQQRSPVEAIAIRAMASKAVLCSLERLARKPRARHGSN
jgi:hypothetical protein